MTQSLKGEDTRTEAQISQMQAPESAPDSSVRRKLSARHKVEGR
jgi:hypothetical protein